MSDFEGAAYQKSLLLHQHAKIPRTVATGLRLVDDDGVEQTLATDGGDHGVLLLDVAQALTEDLAEALGTLCELLLFHDLECLDSHGRAQRVTAVCRAVGTGLDSEHDIFSAEDAGDRVHATRDSLAEQDNVGLDA